MALVQAAQAQQQQPSGGLVLTTMHQPLELAQENAGGSRGSAGMASIRAESAIALNAFHRPRGSPARNAPLPV